MTSGGRALAVFAVLIAGCAAPVTEPLQEAVIQPVPDTYQVPFNGTLWYREDVASFDFCPVAGHNSGWSVTGDTSDETFAHAGGPLVNATGALVLDVVFEWEPVTPVMESIRIAWDLNSNSPGLSSPPERPERFGPTPLDWQLSESDLTAKGAFMIGGPACSAELTEPRTSQGFNQTVQFFGNLTFRTEP
ncbi:MAG: hypothetical protein WC876_04350 [Candidatus Thermoplasmatota archaeon]